MNKQNYLFTVYLLFGLVFTANAEQSVELEKTILSLDKQLFDAFNSCNIKRMSELLDQKLEFYHDKDGLTGYTKTLESTQNNCNDKLGLSRTLLSKFNIIFPAGEYGAIQEGRHQFCHMNNGKNDCGTFKFLHIWKRSGKEWTLSRVVSYDH